MSKYTTKEERLQKLLEELTREIEQGYAGPDLFDLMYRCDHLSFAVMTVLDRQGHIVTQRLFPPGPSLHIPSTIQTRLDRLNYTVVFSGATLWREEELTISLEDDLSDWEREYFEEGSNN